MDTVFGTNLTLWDSAVLAFYVVFMFVIGFVYKSFSSDSSDYFRGGGSMLWWMVGASAFMTQFSAWTFTGAAGKAYTDGALVAMIFFGNAVGYLLNYFVTSYRFRRMRVVTPIDAVLNRFGAINEQLFTWTQIPSRVLYGGIWLNGLAIVVASIFKIDPVITVWVVGISVLVMSVAGGAWAVIASDFIQVLLLMCISIVTCVLALSHPAIGGFSGLIDKVPDHHFSFSLAENSRFVYIWIFTAFVVQAFKLNNMFDSYRYLCVKDDQQAKKASLMACFLMFVGPVIWFIPPMAARVIQPDMGAVFPDLANPVEGAFVYMGMEVLPVGMIGLLVCSLFASTMSSMDSGLNVNAGIIVNNFYKPILRKNAGEKELLLVGKIMSAVFGILIILAGLLWLNLKDWDLFEIMTVFGSMIAIPIAMPLVWGLFIKGAPRWSAWSTVLVGFSFSIFSKVVEQYGLFGLGEIAGREKSDFLYFFSGLGNIVVCSLWFFMTVWLGKMYKNASEKELLLVEKIMSAVFGILIVLTGLFWLNLKDWGLFEIMNVFGSMIAIPIAMPLVWGLFIKGAPRWSAWSTVLVGFLFFVFSKVVEQYGLFGFGETAGREKSVFLYFFSGLGNIVVCSLWFFVTVWAAKMNKYEPEDRVEKFFENQNRPVDHDGEGGKDSDNNQGVAMGVLCLIYGGFISLLAIVIPNGLTGRLSFLFCGLVIGGIGFGIYRFGKKKSPSTE